MKDNKLAVVLFCLLFLVTAFGLALLSPKAERNKATNSDAYAEFVRSMKHKPHVVYRDGDWVEIELPSGELSFEDDPRCIYGEPDAQR